MTSCYVAPVVYLRLIVLSLLLLHALTTRSRARATTAVTALENNYEFSLQG